ncbi:NADase-type glycan-binding domain-containing protein [Mycobacteroides abscessus]|uniref:NADase-type glycan-binding domain-containing protein n=1 Tax=Mycobacteroides abscessus TaxID=36809 RepID=UPI0009A8657D|nr:hypothetical protein [Mycobacteroides abscessus]SKT85619.1 F5/8 type C domain-containing protein [Mycobacteroides abscessus subsp. massiliense]SKU05165.1 F5/8 type C domain-containing protein [Mycobacteroides abscessus subsp. massiliense]
MTTTTPQPDQDQGWENRALILASVAPRSTTRPARHGSGTTALAAPTPDSDDLEKDLRPGAFTRTVAGIGRAARWSRDKFNDKVPRKNRGHAALLAAGVIVVLIVAGSVVRFLAADVSPAPTAASSAAAPPPVSTTPKVLSTVITPASANDYCKKDDGTYQSAMNMFDNNFNTAWVCTRVNNEDGQLIQVTFDQQVTISQIRCVGGFDAYAPDGTDLWSKHRPVTKLEIYFPKELRRAEAEIDTGGVRDWRFTDINPPATVSTLLLRIKETTDPPAPPTPTTETRAPGDETTTTAISECQFIGVPTNAAPA